MDDLNEYMETVLLPDEQFDALFCLFRLSHSNAFAIYPCDGTVRRIYALGWGTSNYKILLKI